MIVVIPNMFTLKQAVHVIENTYHQIVDVANDKMPEAIAILCDEHKVKNVQLYGQPEYLEPIAEEIKNINLTKYNNSDIKVEVIPNV